MTHNSLTGHSAVAWGARLALVDYIHGVTSTSGCGIIDTLANWINQGEISGTVSVLETELDMYRAAAIAASDGHRVFAVTTGENLMMAFNLLNAASHWRVPMVLFNLIVHNQADTREYIPDHDAALAARDSGFIQFYCTSCQELLDTILLAYRLSEDESVRIPVLITLEQQHPGMTHEQVAIPHRTAARQFIGSYQQPIAMPEVYALAPRPEDKGPQSAFRYSIHLASQQALAVYDDLAEEYRDFFGRYHPAIVAHSCEDADYVFILTGACVHHADEAAAQLRKTGWKVGVLRPRLIRPFPQDSLISLLRGKRAVAVIDTHLSPGKGGVLHGEIVSALYGQRDTPPIVASFIVGPGCHEVTLKQFLDIATILRGAEEAGLTPQPRVLTA